MSAFGSVTTMLARPAIKRAEARAAALVPNPTPQAKVRLQQKAERHGTGWFFIVVGSIVLLLGGWLGGKVVITALHAKPLGPEDWKLMLWFIPALAGLALCFIGAMRLDPDLSGAITATGTAVGDAAGKIKNGVKS